MSAVLVSYEPSSRGRLRLYLYLFEFTYLRHSINEFGHDHRRNLPGYEGYRYPHFSDWGTVYPTLQDTGEEFAVNCCQHIIGQPLRLNYTKPVFVQGRSVPDQAREFTTLPIPYIKQEGWLPPTKRASAAKIN